MIDNPTAIALALGMIISLILTETVGVTAGGLIVPGYIAIYLHEPYMVIVTFSISLLTLLILKLLSKHIIIYGKRRLVFCLILSFFLGALIREFSQYVRIFKPDISFLYGFEGLHSFLFDFTGNEMIFIGYLIPGLISSWMDKQGVVSTAAIIFIISGFINLLLMVLGKLYV